MSKSKSFFLFLTGIAVGAAAGILFAPHRGEKTRRKMAKRIRKISGYGTDKALAIGERIKDGYQSTKGNLAKAF
jgi:gas vesicle protein